MSTREQTKQRALNESKQGASKKRRGLGLAVKLVLCFLAVGAIPTGTVALYAVYKLGATMDEETFVQLEVARGLKQRNVEQLIEFTRRQMTTVEEYITATQSVQELAVAFRRVAAENQFTPEQQQQIRREGKAFYTGPFQETYRRLNAGRDPGGSPFESLGDAALALQYLYIQRNPNALGSKHLLDQAGDRSHYSALHGGIQPVLRSLVENFGYEDILLVEGATGTVVYSVAKAPDFATSLRDGPWARSGLGEAYRRALELGSGDLVMTDFSPYRPGFDAPAAFISMPIFDARDKDKVGALIIRLPLGFFNEAMQNPSGQAETAETFLVGPDFLMRSDARLDAEHRSIAHSWRNSDTGRIEDEYVQRGFKGEFGQFLGTDYRGKDVLVSTSPLKVGGLVWLNVAKQDERRVLDRVREWPWLMAIALAAGALLIVSFTIWFRGVMVNPLLFGVQTLENIAAGDFSKRIKVKGGDELGWLFHAINDTAAQLAESQTSMTRSKNLVENAPFSIMMADRDLNLIYMNPASSVNLKQVERFLPVRVDQMLGKGIDMFHKDPALQRKILSDPKNLPHFAEIQLGPEWYDVTAAAILDVNGNYIGPMLTWNTITERKKAEERDGHVQAQVTTVAKDLAASSETLVQVSKTMSANAEETAVQADTVTAAAEQVSANVRSVAAAVEEMTATIREVSKTVLQSAEVTQQAVKLSKQAGDLVDALGESSQQIGEVTKVIAGIAQQTNILALNATIEAARAGAAGKGFAVVANEVKELANSTGKMTSDISSRIASIQESTGQAVKSIDGVNRIMGELESLSSTVASAVEEQSATTGEISRNMSEAATGVNEIVRNITGMAHAAKDTSEQALNSKENLAKLGGLASQLSRIVEMFSEVEGKSGQA